MVIVIAVVIMVKNTPIKKSVSKKTLKGKSSTEKGKKFDLAGPVAVAIAGTPVVDTAGASEEEAPPEPRLVVFGDSDFAANHAIEAVRNRDLFVNSVNWLVGDVESITIRPAISRASRVLLSNADLNMLRPLTLFVLPELLMVAGVLVWWRRRAAAA